MIALSAGCASTAAGPTTGPGSSGTEIAGPTYSGLDDTGRASDLLVLGTFSGDSQAHEDDGGLPGEASQKVIVREFHVAQAKPSSTLKVIKIALPESPERPSGASLAADASYALFLERITEEQRGGLKGLGDLYLPVSATTGMYSVKGDQATPLVNLEAKRSAAAVPLKQLWASPIGP